MDHRPPIGFRFYPTEEELISFYLHHKLRGTGPDLNRIIPVVDIYAYNPQDLPGLAGELYGQESEQWFFFVPRQEREARGGRPNRLTNHGYWKATGSPCDVYSGQNRKIGRKRTMVFYTGRAPNGMKTVWKMNEYKAIVDRGGEVFASFSSIGESSPHQQLREDLSLCRIYKRSKCLRSAFDRRPRLDQQLCNNDILAKPYFHHRNDYADTVHDYAITANPRRSLTLQNLTTVTAHGNNNYSMDGSSSVDDHRFNAHNSLCVGTVSGPTDTSLCDWEHELINCWFDDI